MKNRMLALAFGAALLSVVACGGRPEPPAPSAEKPGAETASPRTGTVAARDGVRIAYEESGSGTPAIVLVHGWSCDRSFWKDQVADLSKDHLVVAVDLPGHGDSGSEREEWSVEALGDDVRRVVESLGLEAVVLVGHSMGGPVVLETAAQIPARVAMVVGVDTFQDIGEKPDPKRWGDLLARFDEDFPGTCGEFVKSMFPADADPALVRSVGESMCDANPAIATALLRSFEKYDGPAAFAKISSRIACVQGALFPTNVEGNRGYAPGFEVRIVEGTGHFPQLEKPAEFNANLRALLGS